MVAFAPPTLLAPPPPSRDNFPDVMASLASILNPLAPLAQAGAQFYAGSQAAKAAEKAAKREQELELARIQAQAGAASVSPGWLTPPVFIGAAVGVVALVLLLRR